MSAHPCLRLLGEWVRAAAGALFCVSALSLAGCQSGGAEGANPPATAGANAPGVDRYKVTADSTSFYLYGPQEPNGPDQTLKKDTEVTMIKRAYGFSRVKTPDGQSGYVGTEDLTQLSAQDIAAENATQQQAAQAEAQKRLGSTGSGGTYTIPPEAGNDERLPVADPAPAPKPPPNTFRY